MKGWAVWKRWCSVCAVLYVDVFPARRKRIECKCGAWFKTPRLFVAQGGK